MTRTAAKATRSSNSPCFLDGEDTDASNLVFFLGPFLFFLDRPSRKGSFLLLLLLLLLFAALSSPSPAAFAHPIQNTMMEQRFVAFDLVQCTHYTLLVYVVVGVLFLFREGFLDLVLLCFPHSLQRSGFGAALNRFVAHFFHFPASKVTRAGRQNGSSG